MHADSQNAYHTKILSGKSWPVFEDLTLHTVNILTVDYAHSVRFEVFTAASMKNAVFWDAVPC
jgi:hypothetical protein